MQELEESISVYELQEWYAHWQLEAKDEADEMKRRERR